MDADDERLTDWGASRRTYYGGDTADLEIGQKDEDAVEEEALARAPVSYTHLTLPTILRV